MGGIFAESDMESLAELARGKGVSLKVLSAAREVNLSLADRIVDKISTMVKSVQNKDVGILGLAFKPNTNSVAGSSSLRLAQNLVARGRPGSRLRSGGHSRSAHGTEWHRALLRNALRRLRRHGRAGGRHRLARISRPRFRSHQTPAEAPRDRGHQEPSRLSPPARHGIRIRRRRPPLRFRGPPFPAWRRECTRAYHAHTRLSFAALRT